MGQAPARVRAAPAVDGRAAPPEVHGVSDDIISLEEYLRRREEDDDGEGPEGPGSTFALWGADGERSRFALPLWRAIYLCAGERGGIVWVSDRVAQAQPFVVLDLACDPPRTQFEGVEEPPPPAGPRAPRMARSGEGGLAVFLGEEKGRRWYMVLEGAGAEGPEPAGRDREDILFLAGECAGLLFLRGFAGEA